jgi:hypothetical protein
LTRKTTYRFNPKKFFYRLTSQTKSAIALNQVPDSLGAPLAVTLAAEEAADLRNKPYDLVHGGRRLFLPADVRHEFRPGQSI